MLNYEIYQANVPEVITQEQLDTAVSGLSLLSRDIIRDELIRAQQDTSMEYHRNHDRDVQKLLHKEIQCLNFLIASCIRVSNEYRKITSSNRSDNVEVGKDCPIDTG